MVRLSGAPDEPFTVSVLNSMGQELRRWDRFNAQTDALDLSGLPTGLLFVRIGEGAGHRYIQVMHVH
jgi:hypothetical protein